MNEPMALEDVLSGKQVVESEEVEAEAQESQEDEPVVEAEPETEVEATEEPTGDIKPEKEPETEPPSVENVKEVPLAAMLDERDKRKALQAELEQLKATQAAATKEKVDFWENPEAAIQSVEDKLRGEFQQTFQNGLLAFSMQSASYRHQDYDSMRDAFSEAAGQNPALVDQALQSSDPGEYIYETGKQFKQLDEVGGNIDTLKERMRAELKAELMQEFQTKDAKLKSVPTPITDETSAMTAREKVTGGPTPLENIFKHNRG